MAEPRDVADELNLLAAELIGQQRTATIAGDGVCIRVRAPNALIRTLVRASEILCAEADRVDAALRSPGLDGERMLERCAEACDRRARSSVAAPARIAAEDLAAEIRALAHEEKAGC